MCKLKWLEISYNLRKFCTLKELVLEAKENVDNPYKCRKHKKRPDLPKKPLTAYLCFFKKMQLQYTKNTLSWATRSWPRFCLRNTRSFQSSWSWNIVKISRRRNRSLRRKWLCQRTAPWSGPELHEIWCPQRKPNQSAKEVSGKCAKSGLPPKQFIHEEPKKPPTNGYHKFHQDLWLSRELKGLPWGSTW